jgi:hypothetical protein
LFRPSRRRTQLTVARETPTCTAICLLVQRGRRSRSISTTATAGVTDGADAGMSDPATRPILHGDIDQPTSERSAGITPAASATASGVCPLSTSCTIRSRPAWREPGILVHVHPVLPRIAEASQLQLPRSGPGGQPNESSQLAQRYRGCTAGSDLNSVSLGARSACCSGRAFVLKKLCIPKNNCSKRFDINFHIVDH